MKEWRKDLEEEQERIYNLIAQEKEQEKNNAASCNQAGGPTRIKVRWKSTNDSKESDTQIYTSESLRMMFSKYGNVNVVVVSYSSTARKGK